MGAFMQTESAGGGPIGSIFTSLQALSIFQFMKAKGSAHIPMQPIFKVQNFLKMYVHASAMKPSLHFYKITSPKVAEKL